jgi:transcriptional regulator with XRE-family HTH domain
MNAKETRQALGLTQRALAEKLGVSVTTVSAWETGRRNPSQMSRKFMATMTPTRPTTHSYGWIKLNDKIKIFLYPVEETGERFALGNDGKIYKKIKGKEDWMPTASEEVGGIDPYFEDEEGNRASLIDLDGRTVSYLLKLGHKVHTGK